MNNGNAYQQAVSERYRQMEQLNNLRKNQRKYGIGDYADMAYKGSRYLGQAGKGLMQSSNPNVANFGGNLYKYTGQEFVDNFKNNPYDTTKNAYNGIKAKWNSRYAPTGDKIYSAIRKEFPIDNANTNMTSGLSDTTKNTVNSGTTNTLNNFNGNPTGGASGIVSTTPELSQGAETTGKVLDLGKGELNLGKDMAQGAGQAKGMAEAGKTAMDAAKGLKNVGQGAGGAFGGALGTLSVGSDVAQKKYDDAAIDGLSAIVNFIPVYGWAISGALQVAKMAKNMVKDSRDKQVQKNNEINQANLSNKTQDNKSSALQGLQENGQNMLNSMNQQQSPSSLKDEISTQVFSDMYKKPENKSMYQIDTNTPPVTQTPDNGASSFSGDVSTLTDEQLQAIIDEDERKYA